VRPVPRHLARPAIHRDVYGPRDQSYDKRAGVEMTAVIQDCITAFAQLLLGAALFGLIAAAVDLLFDAV
jgi:hypothetical protein